MRKLAFAAIAAAVLLTAACSNNKKTAPVAEIVADNDSVADSTAYGRCGANTAMHTLELVTDKGDTLSYRLESEDTCADVQGGLFIGDRLAVVGTRDADGGMTAQKVINLTSLLGKWASIDKSFEIHEGGTVISNVKEPSPYTEWKILNGRLVLSADTFSVYALGPDSLYLENANGIYGYKRMSKETGGKKPE